MSARLRTLIAGAAGMVLAFGIAELAHGLYELVPSIFVALSQLVIRLTPGNFATQAIETLGGADVPLLIVSSCWASLVFERRALRPLSIRRNPVASRSPKA